jgi:hypothetical protein
MKKIITSSPLDSVAVKDLPIYPIIGAANKNGKLKTFVVMTEYHNKNSYKFLSSDGIQTGNGYSMHSGNLASVFSHPEYDFFLFDSTQDLYKWLATE